MASSHVLPSTGRGFPQPVEAGKIIKATTQLETNMKMVVHYTWNRCVMDSWITHLMNLHYFFLGKLRQPLGCLNFIALSIIITKIAESPSACLLTCSSF